MLDVVAARSGRTLSLWAVDWSSDRQLHGIHLRKEYRPRIEAGRRLLSSGRAVISGGYMPSSAAGHGPLHARVPARLLRRPGLRQGAQHPRRRLLSAEECSDERATRVFPAASMAEAVTRAARFLDSEECKADSCC